MARRGPAFSSHAPKTAIVPEGDLPVAGEPVLPGLEGRQGEDEREGGEQDGGTKASHGWGLSWTRDNKGGDNATVWTNDGAARIEKGPVARTRFLWHWPERTRGARVR